MKVQRLVSHMGVKGYLHGFPRKYHVDKDVYAALEEHIKDLLLKAVERARANQRTTVMGRDI